MMYLLSVTRVIGLLLMVFSLTMLLPLAVSVLYGENIYRPFAYSFAITFLAGFFGWLVARKHVAALHLKEAFLIVVVAWLVISVFGAFPFYMLTFPQMDFTESVFESVAGLTTTGATTLSGLDTFPYTVLFYRHVLQWFGGLGIILIAAAITPILGIGGMQLYRTEMLSAKMSGNQLPRVKDMARVLWLIYLFLTVACAILYWVAGMSVFDAICHSFSTVSIGGFSTHDASFAYFADRPAILFVAIVFMLLAATSFSLHFFVWRRKSLLVYWRDAEFKTFLVIVFIMVMLTSITLINAGHHNDLIEGIFHAVSITTTSGFVVGSSEQWPAVIFTLLLFASFIGGCTGSTAGGMRVIRFWLLLKQGLREMGQLIHPDSIVSLKVGNKVLDDKTIQSVWGFFSAYVGSLILITIALTATGLDQESAFSAAAAMINNLGPGLGQVADNYSVVTPLGKWILCFAMLLGRLEVFALLIVFSPMFWRK